MHVTKQVKMTVGGHDGPRRTSPLTRPPTHPHTHAHSMMSSEERETVRARGRDVLKDNAFLRTIAHRTGVYMEDEVRVGALEEAISDLFGL